MLSLYGSITVPEVPDVVVYRDDEDPHRFYMVSGKPRVLRADPRDPTSTPMLDMIAWLRRLDATNLASGELERGQLLMTVGLEVPQVDQQKIRAHLRAKIAAEAGRGYRFLGLPVRMAEPELSYAPLFLDGEATATTFGPDLQIAAQATSPALGSGTNAVSFSYQLTQDGARVIKQAMEQGSLPIVVQYTHLNLVARIPALTIRIHGERSEVLTEIRNQAVTRLFWGAGAWVPHLVWYMPPSLSTFKSTVQSLTIDIDDGDFREADPTDDLTAELEKMAMSMLQNTILPGFFEKAIPAKDEDEDEKDQGWWLPDAGTTVTGSVDVVITKRDVVQLNHGANGVLGGNLTPAEAAGAVRLADANLPTIPVQKLTVAANVNFQVDQIHSVQVVVDYDQVDDRVGQRIRNAETFTFQVDGAPIQKGWRLAAHADGTSKPEYRYRATVIFKNSNRIEVFPPLGGWATGQGDFLVVSYAQLGQVKVDLILGPMPAEVASVDLRLTYPDPALPGAEQVLSLSPAKPTASYLVSTGKTDPIQPYQVAKTFRLVDGSTIDMPVRTETAASLTVTSPFEFRAETTFVARGDFRNDIAAIFVVATYEDPDHGLTARSTLTLDAAHGTLVWTVRQVDKDRRAFRYTVRVMRQNGAETTTDLTGALGEVITVGPSGSDALEVLIDAELADWTKYARLLLTLTYADPAHGVALTKPLMFTDTGVKQQTWTALIADPTQRNFTWTLRRIGRDPADDRADAPVTTDIPFVTLR